jgi:hypothetical protein
MYDRKVDEFEYKTSAFTQRPQVWTITEGVFLNTNTPNAAIGAKSALFVSIQSTLPAHLQKPLFGSQFRDN